MPANSTKELNRVTHREKLLFKTMTQLTREVVNRVTQQATSLVPKQGQTLLNRVTQEIWLMK
jgi:hypothetical protein